MRHETMHRPVEIGAGLVLEGGLIPSDMIAKIARGQATEQAAADYGTPKGLMLNEEIERAFRMARAAHDEPSADATAQARALLRAFGFDKLNQGALVVGERSFPIDLMTPDGRVPVVVAPEGGLDSARHESGPSGRFRSPALLLQDALNASDDALWGSRHRWQAHPADARLGAPRPAGLPRGRPRRHSRN